MASDRKYGRARSRPGNVPEHIDPELTPPPTSVEEIPGFDSIPPPIQEQLRMLRSNQDRMLSERRYTEWVTRVDEKLGTLATFASQHEAVQNQLLIPGFKECAKSTDEIARQLPKIIASLEAVTLTVGAIDNRLRNLEVRMETSAAKAEAQHAALETRIALAEQVDRQHTLRLKAIEDAQLVDGATQKALEKTSRKSGAASGGVVAGVVYAVIQAVQHFAK